MLSCYYRPVHESRYFFEKLWSMWFSLVPKRFLPVIKRLAGPLSSRISHSRDINDVVKNYTGIKKKSKKENIVMSVAMDNFQRSYWQRKLHFSKAFALVRTVAAKAVGLDYLPKMNIEIGGDICPNFNSEIGRQAFTLFTEEAVQRCPDVTFNI